MRAQCLVFRTPHLNTLSKLYVPNYSRFAWLQDLLTQPQKRHNKKPSAYFQNTDIPAREWAWREGLYSRRGRIHLCSGCSIGLQNLEHKAALACPACVTQATQVFPHLETLLCFSCLSFPPKTDSRWLTWICHFPQRLYRWAEWVGHLYKHRMGALQVHGHADKILHEAPR